MAAGRVLGMRPIAEIVVSPGGLSAACGLVVLGGVLVKMDEPRSEFAAGFGIPIEL